MTEPRGAALKSIVTHAEAAMAKGQSEEMALYAATAGMFAATWMFADDLEAGDDRYKGIQCCIAARQEVAEEKKDKAKTLAKQFIDDQLEKNGKVPSRMKVYETVAEQLSVEPGTVRQCYLRKKAMDEICRERETVYRVSNGLPVRPKKQ